MDAPATPQRIGRLAPLPEIEAALARLAAPVAPRTQALAAAAGRVLAADVVAAAAVPSRSTAGRDGWAVRAEAVADAGPYAPVPFAAPPRRVQAGDPLPPDCDAVLPVDAVAVAAGRAEALAPAGAGEGVTAAGFDADPGMRLAAAGTLLRPAAMAALAHAGVTAVTLRVPRAVLLPVHPAVAPLVPLFAAAAAAEGAEPFAVAAGDDLAPALRQAAPGADALITIGGTGEGERDRTAHALAAAGELLLHGLGIRPGETAGLGTVAGRPVLMLPGRLDAALAAWLLVGVPLLRRLAARTPPPPRQAALARKLVSTIGLAEAVLVEAAGAAVAPIASGAFPAHALARAAGWVAVPPSSEGYPAGTVVAVHPLP